MAAIEWQLVAILAPAKSNDTAYTLLEATPRGSPISGQVSGPELTKTGRLRLELTATS
ncbi:hypothetical protein CDAR_46031, partial [Caerostris darwini]